MTISTSSLSCSSIRILLSGCEARQHPGGVIVVEELAAEFQVQLAAELRDAFSDLLRLRGEIFLIVKSDGSHISCPLCFLSVLWFARSPSPPGWGAEPSLPCIIPYFPAG
jgi:hypothetical protein